MKLRQLKVFHYEIASHPERSEESLAYEESPLLYNKLIVRGGRSCCLDTKGFFALLRMTVALNNTLRLFVFTLKLFTETNQAERSFEELF